MAKKHSKKDRDRKPALPQETKRAIVVITLSIVGVFLLLAAFGAAGVAGSDTYDLFDYLLGVGYFLLPILFFVLAGGALKEESTGFTATKGIASLIFFIAGLGYVDLVANRGGLLGGLIADPAAHYFDIYGALVLLGGLSLISLLVLLEGKISLEIFTLIGRAVLAGPRALLRHWYPAKPTEPSVSGLPEDTEEEDSPEEDGKTEDEEPEHREAPLRAPVVASTKETQAKRSAEALKALLGQYTPPPLSLLERDKGRPGVGDIKGNANIIKRTLANFGITVELDEISIGPSVTRYAIKPAEGVRLQKIVSLQTNLELALAAHPVRIEAPIPGKSLVGIEVPNSAKVTVGLGTLLEAHEFANSPKPLLVALGRDIAGSSHFANIAKMPHILIAGATGSGKSVTIHAVINSLLYRCGPQQLRFLMIDPKRVELTLYNRLPHLLTPVITDPKKAIAALRWAVKEMERRYTILEEERVRDIESYHQNVLAPALEKLRAGGVPDEDDSPAGSVPEAMPYIVVVIDELADIMQTFPRELEAAIVRLAQMSRAVGIHLLLSTQRPSVNVITGLIKANVPSRLALQVASQIDSRTILDQGGAEKLLGAGDMLYLGGEMGKPVRLQSAFIGEAEVKKVTDFISKHNEVELPIDMGTQAGGPSTPLGTSAGGFGDEEEVDDDMYEAARQAVIEAQKASTSYLQRKLRVGYARAARLIDILEERGVIGPGDGAKPREILEKPNGMAETTPEEL
ncbi:MAG: segregation ATPase FtsK/SpoIIIE, family [Patescibacteria group bacterium]|nr:segregation ATPase FtsK/SpoIIIE, family [Patescibacteria group bacterium]